jgi:hypothetical protein
MITITIETEGFINSGQQILYSTHISSFQIKKPVNIKSLERGLILISSLKNALTVEYIAGVK